MSFIFKLVTNGIGMTINCQNRAQNVVIIVAENSTNMSQSTQQDTAQSNPTPINCETASQKIDTVDESSINIAPAMQQDDLCTVKSNETSTNCKATSQKSGTADGESRNICEEQDCNSSGKRRTDNNENDDEPLKKRCNTMGTNEENGSKATDTDSLECAVCLQPCVLPVQLPCDHIFCYLCVKGLAQQNTLKCALCRQEISQNFLNNPRLIPSAGASEGTIQWFYKGQNGWWQYDDRTSMEIEASYEKGDQECEVTIAGFLYTIDFQKSIQFRKDNPHRRRHIKRDLVTITKKGVAGIGLNSKKDKLQ